MKIEMVIIAALLMATPLLGAAPAEQSGQGPRAYTAEPHPGMVSDNLLWNPVVELTWLGSARNPVLMYENGTYNVVWQDNREGNWDIYYLRLTPYGFKVVNDTRITSYPGEDINPSMAIRGEHIFIVWQRFAEGRWNIYFARLTYSNRNITIDVPPKKVIDSQYNCTEPKITIDNSGFLHLVWQEEYGGRWRIMYDKLDESGNRVFAPITVSAGGNATHPALAVTPKNGVEVLWLSNQTTPGYGLMYRGLDCCGYHLTPIRRISIVSPGTEIVANFNQELQVVFSDKRENRSYEIIYTELNSTGITLLDDRNLTAIDGLNSSQPTMVSMRNRMFLAWRDSPGLIKFAEFRMDGTRAESAITLSGVNSSNPTLAVGTHTLAVVWTEKVGNHTYLFMRSAEIPNLSVENISAAQNGTIVNVSVRVKDTPDMPLNCEYILYLDGKKLIASNATVDGEKTLDFALKPGGGWHNVSISLDPENSIYETDEKDNSAHVEFFFTVHSFRIEYPHDIYMNSTGGNMSINVINTGNAPDSYTLSVGNHSTLLRIHTDKENISAGPGDRAVFNITIVPKTDIPVGTYNLSVNVTSASGDTEWGNISLHIIPRSAFILHYSLAVYALPNTMHTIPVYVTNAGNFNDTYIMRINTSAPWPVKMKNASANVPIGKTGKFIINLTVPPGVPAFSTDVLSGSVVSESSNRTENFTITVSILPLRRVSLSVVYSSYDAGAYIMAMEVKNTGNIADMYAFNISGPLAEYTTLSTYSALLPMGKSTVVNITVNIPANTTSGAHHLTFNALLGNSTVASRALTISVPAKYSFTASASSTGKSRLEIMLVVRNTGNAIETVFIKPDIGKNITWVLKHDSRNYTNETYIVLHPGESKTVEITTPEKLADGTYTVKINLLSPTAGNMTVTVKAQIGNRNSGILGAIMDNILYIAIAAVAGVAAAVYFLRRE